MAKYAKLTKEDVHICPYCGSKSIDWLGGGYDKGDNEVRYRCQDCGEDYYVMFDPDSWDEEEQYYAEVEDVTDRHRRTLLED